MTNSPTPRYNFPNWVDGDVGWGDSVEQAFRTIESVMGTLQDTAVRDLTIPAVASGTYSAAANTLVRMDTLNVAATVNLPSNPAAGTRVSVMLWRGTHRVTINAGSGDLIDIAPTGSSSMLLTLPRQSVTLRYANGVWAIVGGYVDPATIDGSGSGVVSLATLRTWVAGEAYELLSTDYANAAHPTVPTSASVLWPDGNVGKLTVTIIDDVVEAIDAYEITYDTPTASPVTVVQTRVTRNALGAVVTKPALIVRSGEIPLAALDPDTPFAEYGDITMHDLTTSLATGL